MNTNQQEHNINLRVTSYMQLVIKKAGSWIYIRNQSPKTNDGEEVFKRVINMLDLMSVSHQKNLFKKKKSK